RRTRVGGSPSSSSSSCRTTTRPSRPLPDGPERTVPIVVPSGTPEGRPWRDPRKVLDNNEKVLTDGNRKVLTDNEDAGPVRGGRTGPVRTGPLSGEVDHEATALLWPRGR